MEPEYVKKTAVKEGSCFVCNKFTTNVLRNDSDWFFSCTSHLKDPGFCKTKPIDKQKDVPKEGKELEEIESEKIGFVDGSIFILHSSFLCTQTVA